MIDIEENVKFQFVSLSAGSFNTLHDERLKQKMIRKALLKCWHTSLSMTICRNYPSSESERFLPVGEREENIPCDLNNTEWFRKIDASNGAALSPSSARLVSNGKNSSGIFADCAL